MMKSKDCLAQKKEIVSIIKNLIRNRCGMLPKVGVGQCSAANQKSNQLTKPWMDKSEDSVS